MKNWYLLNDAAFVAGSANFAALISATPTVYGLVAAQATAFGLLNTALQTAWTACTEPSTRTPVAIEQKNLCRRNVKNSATQLSKIINATLTVTDAQLTALGLQPRPTRTPVPVYGVPPALEVVSVNGRLMKLRIHDPEAETRRGKPPGTVGCNIYTFVGPEAPTDPRQYHYEGMATRPTVDVIFPNSVASGATAWVSGCWVMTRGYTSVGSVPIQVTIQGGLLPAEAA